MKDITYCTCSECPLECDNHINNIPKGETHASFAELYRICKPYIRLLLNEVMEENKMPGKISEFRGKYYGFSNFGPGEVTVFGYKFDNGEAAFHSQKDPSRAAEFVGLNPSEAKKLGRRVKLRPDWEQVKDSIMEKVVFAKFSQNEDLKQLLLATGDAELIEGNTWGDMYWGQVNGIGLNKLGKILMKVRFKLKIQ